MDGAALGKGKRERKQVHYHHYQDAAEEPQRESKRAREADPDWGGQLSESKMNAMLVRCGVWVVH